MVQVTDFKNEKDTHIHAYIHIYHTQKKMEISATYDTGNSDVRCT